MGFDVNKFQSSHFKPRTADIPVPDLAQFFGKDEKPVWKVRGLTGEEIARANEANSRNRAVAAVIEALTSAKQSEKAEGFREMLGMGDSVPDDLAKRMDHLAHGSVEPEIDHSTAVKLFTHYPIVAYQLTNKILELTGQGSELGKPKRSTETKESVAS